MKSNLIFVSLTVAASLLIGCSSPIRSVYSSGDCPFKAPNWMSVSDSTSKHSVIDLNANLSAYANLLSVILNKADTSQLPSLRAEYNKRNQRFSASKAMVDQKFYEYYVGRSIELCGVWEYVRKNNFSDATLKSKYENLLYDMQVDFQGKNTELTGSVGVIQQGKNNLLIAGNNTAPVNVGDVNINSEKQLTEVDKGRMLSFIENLYKGSKNKKCFSIMTAQNSNGGKVAMQIETFLKSQGYKVNGVGMAFGSQEGVNISVERDSYLNIVVGVL